MRKENSAPPIGVTMGLLLSHDQDSPPLDTRELMAWFANSAHGAPGFIGSADTLAALRLALEFAEITKTRIQRVHVYPELSIAPEKLQFAHLSVLYRILSDAQVANEFIRCVLAITDNPKCMEQVWKWIGHVCEARPVPVFTAGGIITLTFFPDHPRPYHAFQKIAYCEPLTREEGSQKEITLVPTPYEGGLHDS